MYGDRPALSGEEEDDFLVQELLAKSRLVPDEWKEAVIDQVRWMREL